MAESRSRSVAKSLSWRLIASSTTVALVYLFTGEVHVAIAVAGVEVVAKLVIFYFHERVWQAVSWGAIPS